jgi:hypothetical protein
VAEGKIKRVSPLNFVPKFFVCTLFLVGLRRSVEISERRFFRLSFSFNVPQRGAAGGRQFVSAKAVDAHVRYLERDGVTKDGEKGQVYSAVHETR